MREALRLGLIKWLYLGQSGRAELYRRLASFSAQDIPLKEAISRIHHRYVEHRDLRQWMTRSWLNQIKAGYAFSDALHGWVPTSEQLLLDAAVRSGSLRDGFERAVWLSENAAQVQRRILAAVSYPILVLALLVGIIVWFSLFLIPVFAEVIPPEGWQGQARELYQLSQFLTRHGMLLLLGMTLTCVAFVWSVPNWVGPLRAWLDRWPPYGLYRIYQSAVFLVSLSAMVRAGIPVYEALMNIQRGSSRWLREKVYRMCVRLRTGTDPGQAMHSPLFDRETLDDLHVYGVLDNFDVAIQAMGERIIVQSVRRAELLGRALNYLLLIFSGLFIAWMVAALYSLPEGMNNVWESGNSLS